MAKRKLWMVILCCAAVAAVVAGGAMLIAGRGIMFTFGAAAKDVVSVKATCTVVVEGFDWGPAVTKAVLTLGAEIDPDSVTGEAFQVSEHVQYMDFQKRVYTERDFPGTVLAAYTSDADGNPVDRATAYVAIELEEKPDGGSPFFYDSLVSGQNVWADPYILNVKLTGKAALTAGGSPVAFPDMALQTERRIIPQTDMFTDVAPREYAGGVTMAHSHYIPPEDGKQNALIIWLHGASKGGADKNIVLLGNKVSALGAPAIQDLFGGAYVLCPQVPTMWMDNGEVDPDTGKPVYVTDANHASIYTEGLMDLIEQFVAEHADIDPGKIIIGGCSNGGFMTIDMLIHYPGYFRAAYPICEAYKDSWISDEQLRAIASIPLWFTYAVNDKIADPTIYSEPTVKRLRAFGADLHTSVFPKVVDATGRYKNKDGSAYEYIGHWSWIYMLNNECFDTVDGQEVAIWNWLAGLVQ